MRNGPTHQYRSISSPARVVKLEADNARAEIEGRKREKWSGERPMRVDRKGAQLKTRSGGRPSLTLSFWVRFPLSRSSSSFFSSPPTLFLQFHRLCSPRSSFKLAGAVLGCLFSFGHNWHSSVLDLPAFFPLLHLLSSLTTCLRRCRLPQLSTRVRQLAHGQVPTPRRCPFSFRSIFYSSSCPFIPYDRFIVRVRSLCPSPPLITSLHYDASSLLSCSQPTFSSYSSAYKLL